MQLFSAEHDTILPQRIDTLIGESTKQGPFYPPQPVLDELMNSGRIKSMQNENLKRYLFDWGATLNWFHFDYGLAISFSNDQFQPYLNKHWSWKNIDIAAGIPFYTQRSTLAQDQVELFRQLEFENLVDANLFHTVRLERRLTGMEVLIDNILREIEISLGR